MELTRDDILSAFPLPEQMLRDGIALQGSGVERSARCPFHTDKRPSMSVNVVKSTWYCNVCDTGGSIIDYLARKEGKSTADVFRELADELRRRGGNSAPPPNAIDAPGNPVATYVYRSATGKEVYRVLRFEPKTFRQQKKTAGGWEWGMEGVERVLFNLPEVLAAGDRPVWVCYSPDTEVLTPDGWVPINQPVKMVAQWDHGAIRFVEPQGRTDLDYTGPMINIAADWCDLLVTPDHRCLVKWEPSGPVVIPASKVGAGRLLPVSGFMLGRVPITVERARLLVAWQADGMILNRHRTKAKGDPKAWQHFGWNLKKERKKRRLRDLLTASGLKWKEQQFKSCPSWTLFTVRRSDALWLLELMPDKRWEWSHLDWQMIARLAVMDELQFWDGDTIGENCGRFFTADKQSADVIAALAATSGYSVIVRHDTRRDRSNWIVNYGRRDWRMLGRKPKSVEYSDTVHCLTVPSGFLVVRRNGKVVICGNCEGEKDVNSLTKLGYVATCNVGGAGKWMDGYTAALQGKDVVLCGDNDDAGRKHVERLIEALDGKAKRLRHVVIPEPDKDVSEYLARFGNRETQGQAMESLLEKAAVIVPGGTVPILSMVEMEERYVALARQYERQTYSFSGWLPTFGRRLRANVPGDVIAFVAGTGVGKTALLQNMAINAAPQPVLLFEMELADSLTFERFAARAMGMRCDDVEEAYRQGGRVDWRESRKLNAIYTCTLSGLTMPRIEEIIGRAELKMGVRPLLVMIDYLQLVNGTGKSRYEKITEVMSGVKTVAKNTGTIMVVASQIQRKPEDAGVEVGLTDGKDSGQIENSAGLHIGVWRDKDEDGLLWMRVNKNTKGRPGLKIPCNFDGARMLITEREVEMQRP